MSTPKHRWSDPVKRTEQAVRLREAGWSLRKIAAHQNVSVGTVHGDLARWAQEQTERLIADVQSAVQSASPSHPQLNTGLNTEGSR